MLCDLSARGLAPRTVRYAHAVLRSALDQARRWKLLDENPAVDMPLPRVAKPEIRVLTVKEARRFAAACLGEPHGLALVVALSAGLRPSEYLALRVCDFDPARGTVTITRTIERTRGSWTFAETKRQRSRRTVVLPCEVAKLLSVHIESRQMNTDRLLFENRKRGPLHESNLVQRAFKPLLRRLGLPNIRLYDLRHTFATLALTSGVPALLVSRQLGHASVAFTLDTYGHVLEETFGMAANCLEELLFEPRKKSPAAVKKVAKRRSA